MPELPDVEIFRRLLQRRGMHKRVARVAVSDRRILAKGAAGRLASRLVGARLMSSRRHGKHLLAKIDKGGWLTLHFGMTGSLQFYGEKQAKPRFTRVRIDFARGGHLAYINRRMIGRVGFTADAAAFVARERLGPDALDRRFTFRVLATASRRGRRDIKTVLMDQKTVAGIGNIYADEILFQARVHPRTRADRLEPARLRRVYGRIRSTLRMAIRRGAGSESLTTRTPRTWLLRERRKGGHCPRCRAPLKTAGVHGRTGYYCARCQK